MRFTPGRTISSIRSRVAGSTLRINKRITAFALEAMGMRTALAEMHEVRRTEGMGASLKLRDGKFRPEPGGPRSKR